MEATDPNKPLPSKEALTFLRWFSRKDLPEDVQRNEYNGMIPKGGTILKLSRT